ncbi:hypothetical protein SADUNF_Sadunf05G0195400 [Salix dunnii]|uniref:Uncharacterized protein n=1 Tax=Salix dunnii TaxID=1413687 RepID=A0A835MZY1_9ROSI|nr:hypothetical protein SADUNF_Sadunf05G0195400 [Salix dunnii]
MAFFMKGEPLVAKLAAIAKFGVFPAVMAAALFYSPPDYIFEVVIFLRTLSWNIGLFKCITIGILTLLNAHQISMSCKDLRPYAKIIYHNCFP